MALNRLFVVLKTGQFNLVAGMYSLATGATTVPKFDDVEGFNGVQPVWRSRNLENQVLVTSGERSLIFKMGCPSVYFRFSLDILGACSFLIP